MGIIIIIIIIIVIIVLRELNSIHMQTFVSVYVSIVASFRRDEAPRWRSRSWSERANPFVPNTDEVDIC